MIFVTASHQIGLDTRGFRGQEGREQAETRTLLVYAAHWHIKCNVGLMSQAVSRTQIWVRARMLGYSLN